MITGRNMQIWKDDFLGDWGDPLLSESSKMLLVKKMPEF